MLKVKIFGVDAEKLAESAAEKMTELINNWLVVTQPKNIVSKEVVPTMTGTKYTCYFSLTATIWYEE